MIITKCLFFSVSDEVFAGIMLRIERLEESATNVITQASVLGHRFNFQELLHVIKMDQEKLIEVLEKLEDKKLIHADIVDDELLMFNHSKIQEVLYNNIAQTELVTLNIQVESEILTEEIPTVPEGNTG